VLLLGLGVGVVVALVLLMSAAPSLLRTQDKLYVVTTVAPLTNIALNVAGDRVNLRQIIPDGTDSHTFEPTPSDARALAEADLVVVNGLHLEESTIQLAEANRKPNGRILLLGDSTITPEEWIFDFSFPEEHGDPNPHLWMNPLYAIRYAELVRDQLVELDPGNAAYYRENAARFRARAEQLDAAIAQAVQTIPEKNRKLLTYHDSFQYFAREYGWEVIGAIQPSDFSDPTPQEVAGLIEQVRDEDVPAIFGSEVFPSPVLEQIAAETGVTYVDDLRDDDLPGDPGDPEHSYLGLMVYDYRTFMGALGGDVSAFEGFDASNVSAGDAEYRT
jgi:ABC-type Zn uptake system ZnuABC Zn-binding protein ZnuA